MAHFPIFLSLVLVLRNQAEVLPVLLQEITAFLSVWVDDYEVIIVDNASRDASLSVLRRLTLEAGVPNVQVYALTKEVDGDIASWVGLESALGDYVAFFEPICDPLDFLPKMLEQALNCDVVFARNKQRPRRQFLSQIGMACFNSFFHFFCGTHLELEAPQYRLISKRVVNFILRHPAPATAYRYLPATGGFSRSDLIYDKQLSVGRSQNIFESIDRGIHLVFSTSRGPMRLVSSLCFVGAGSNLVYSLYVIAVAFFKENVAPGWVTLSLQQSGMFLLISLVLLVLGEYVVHMVNLAYAGPKFHVAQEFTSTTLLRRRRLNIEEIHDESEETNQWNKEYSLRHDV